MLLLMFILGLYVGYHLGIPQGRIIEQEEQAKKPQEEGSHAENSH